jgi:undecaprenyl-diphosphatase
MLLSVKNNFTVLKVTGEIVLYLFFFIAIVSLIVYVLRGPLRKYKPADLSVFKKIQKYRTAGNTRIMLAFTYLGKHNFLIPANLQLIFLFLFFGKNHFYAYRMLIMSLSSLILMFILKWLFHRKRPLAPLLYSVKGKSFPSGHAIMAVNFYGLLLYMALHAGIDPSLKIIAAIVIPLLIIAIGFSRVYLQVHYASDVLSGFIIGFCWFYLSLHILNRIELLAGS